jgi:hypothetical protein
MPRWTIISAIKRKGWSGRTAAYLKATFENVSAEKSVTPQDTLNRYYKAFHDRSALERILTLEGSLGLDTNRNNGATASWMLRISV